MHKSSALPTHKRPKPTGNVLFIIDPFDCTRIASALSTHCRGLARSVKR
jgi:hypothetical protein